MNKSERIPLIYNELYASARALYEREREQYAIDRLLEKIRALEAKKDYLKYVQSEIDKMEADLEDLLDKEVGTPPPITARKN